MIASEILVESAAVSFVELAWKQARVIHYNGHMRLGWVLTRAGDIVSVDWNTIAASGLDQLSKDQEVEIRFVKTTVPVAQGLRMLS
jgi:cold shock CspA family protein